MFERQSEAGIVGDEWLLDHVHPSIQGHQQIADALFRDGVPERNGGRTRDAGAVAIRITGWLHRTLREIWITRPLIGRRAGSAEIARALGLAKVTVRWHLHAGRRDLRKILFGE